MRFEEALKSIRDGKKVTNGKLKPVYIFMVPETQQFFVNDGLNDLPIYGIKTEYLMADDWEVVDE